MRILIVVWLTVLLAACVTPGEPAVDNEVRIVRDEFGVPHIYASSIYGLYFGYGYAIAEDRLFQMEMARRSTQGTVAEVLGAEYVDYDKTVRRHFDPNSIQRQLDALNQADRDVFDGYAAGMNAAIEKIMASPESLLPKQFTDIDFMPVRWTGYDVAMIFVGTMINRYGDFNTELENVFIYQTLTTLHDDNALDLFNLLNPRFTDTAATTIPREDWSQSMQDSLAGANLNTFENAPHIDSAVTTGFSNCYVIGKDKVVGANAILVNGPQFGWFNPAYVYSVGMHGAGIDVVGNSPFGYPMVMFGHNSSIAWGSTWGASDIVDLFGERLNPDNSDQYFYRGDYIDFERRIENIVVRNSGLVTDEVKRSVHGPIIAEDEDAGVVFAKQRAWEGRELETLLSWLHATWAQNFDEWKALAEKSAINVNLYFADVDGNIGYFHGGHFPSRAQGHDNRFPVVGDGSMNWQGRQPVDQANPHVFNPSDGFLANWNNKPGHGAMNPDFFFYSWSGADRVDFLHDALSARPKFSPDDAWAIIESSSYADVNARYLLPHIDAAARTTDNQQIGSANNVLQSWDQQSRDADGDGFYDQAGTAIFRVFMNNLVARVLEDDLGDAYSYFSATGYPTSVTPTSAGSNIQPGVKAIVEVLEGRSNFDLLNGDSPDEIIISSMRRALAQLTDRKGQPVEELRLPVAARPFLTNNFLGIPQAGEQESLQIKIEQNRGTENNMIVLQRDAIVGYEVVPPGQSGFIDRLGQKSKHYDDQLDLYQSFGKKRMWFYPDDVDARKQSEIFLKY